jgi:hypothetical protein
MPRIIVKCKYYSSAKNIRDIGGMLKYIGTREGVEKLGDGWQAEPVSKAQEELIIQFCEQYKSCRRMQEYGSYASSKTKGAASEFISAALENHPHLLSDKTYLDYIATRPRVERIGGKHGLFSSDGVAIDLDEEAEKVRQHEGNVFTVIVSLKRHDAERLGYNYAERWRTLVQNRIDDIAKAYKIPPGALKWFGAFHNESYHPHIHLMLYSTDKFEKGFIDKKGIDNLRHLFGTEIFSEDLDNYYKEQTEYRNLLYADARDEIAALADKIKNGLADNGEFVMKFVALTKRMQSVSGKKVYGYLPKSVKAMVNELVDLLEKDEDIERIYELWYQAKCAVYATYTDNPPPKKPLSQEEAFKPIRNAMIKEADELGKILLTLDNEQDEPTEDSPEESDDDKSSTGSSSSHTTNNTTSSTQSTNTAQPKNHSNYTSTRNGYIATSITRFASSLSRIFRDRFDEQAKHAPLGVDSRLKREIEAKKKGQNISM